MPTPTTLPQNLILPSTPAGLARAAQLLKDGHLVILPTETVYGIALNLLSPSARAAATAIKNGKPNWVLHVASPDDVLNWAPSLSPIGRRLISKALPGPIAFQIRLIEAEAAAAQERLGEVADEVLLPDTSKDLGLRTKDFYLTIRCPDFPQTQKSSPTPASPSPSSAPAPPRNLESSSSPTSRTDSSNPTRHDAEKRNPTVGNRKKPEANRMKRGEWPLPSMAARPVSAVRPPS